MSNPLEHQQQNLSQFGAVGGSEVDRAQQAWLATIEGYNMHNLQTLGPSDPTVRDFLSVFQDNLLRCHVDYSTWDPSGCAALDPRMSRPTFELDTTQFSSGGLRMMMDSASTLLPILEFGMSLMESDRTGAPPMALRCLPLGLKPTPFVDLGANSVGKIVAVQGTIVALNLPRLLCREMPFVCTKCGHQTKPVKVDDVLNYPQNCQGRCGAKARAQLLPAPKHALTEEVQYVRIQETAATTDNSSPRGGSRSTSAPSAGGTGMARLTEILLVGPLIDTVMAGDMVSAVGIVGTKPGDKKRAQGTHQVVIQAMHIAPLAGSTSRQAAGHGSNTLSTSTEADQRWAELRQMVVDFNAADPPQYLPDGSGTLSTSGWFKYLRESLCPGIFGHEKVKEGLLMSLVGGSAKGNGKRNNIHNLMIGDPGMGKSQLLRAASSASPRSALVSANTSSACGLTLTLSRDPQTGESTFEGGAVVHGDGGTTCIDEIDKGKSEHTALLEVMEQDSLSIAKAGMIFTMPIHTTILAAGNPRNGKVQPHRKIHDQINMSPALLSRFDLVWLLKDTPASAMEQNIANHVLSMHQRGRGRGRSLGGRGVGGNNSGPDVHGPEPGVFSQAEFREFITLARERCNPVMTPEAGGVLLQAYCDHREEAAPQEVPQGWPQNQIPKRNASRFASVTVRHLEAMMRLSEARAKVELRPEVVVSDVHYAIQMMIDCAASAVVEGSTSGGGTGLFAGPPGSTKAPTSQTGILEVTVMASIRCSLDEEGKISVKVIEELASEAGYRKHNAVAALSNKNLILEAGSGKYRPGK